MKMTFQEIRIIATGPLRKRLHSYVYCLCATPSWNTVVFIICAKDNMTYTYVAHSGQVFILDISRLQGIILNATFDNIFSYIEEVNCNFWWHWNAAKWSKMIPTHYQLMTAKSTDNDEAVLLNWLMTILRSIKIWDLICVVSCR